MNYYKLPPDKQWLKNGNPYVIGGRDTDIKQIGVSLSYRIREMYPPNRIPEEIEEKLRILMAYLETSEQLIEDLIETVSDDVAINDQFLG